MLTIKSKFTNFKNRQGELYTPEDLDTLYQNLVAKDYPNMKVGIGLGYSYTVTKQMIKNISANKDAKIVIFNDLAFHMYNALTDAGFKAENIYLAFGKWKKNGTPADDNYVYDLMKLIAKSSFKEELNIITLKEMFNMKHFDVIISNPPYGKIGAEITDSIRKNVEYGVFANLLPLNDYGKASDELPKYIVRDSVEIIERGAFDDADVTTAICIVSKDIQDAEATADTIKLCYAKFGILNKFFERNAKADYKLPIRQRNFDGMKNRYPVAIHHRDAAHGHLPYQKTLEWQFNTGKICQAEYINKRAEHLKGKLTGNLTSDPIFFDTKAEADNYRNFIYSKDGFRFTSMVWTAYKTDSSEAYEKCFPRVDWSKPQTVLSILKAYDYADDEIDEVISELDNYEAGDMCQ